MLCVQRACTLPTRRQGAGALRTRAARRLRGRHAWPGSSIQAQLVAPRRTRAPDPRGPGSASVMCACWCWLRPAGCWPPPRSRLLDQKSRSRAWPRGPGHLRSLPRGTWCGRPRHHRRDRRLQGARRLGLNLKYLNLPETPITKSRAPVRPRPGQRSRSPPTTELVIVEEYRRHGGPRRRRDERRGRVGRRSDPARSDHSPPLGDPPTEEQVLHCRSSRALGPVVFAAAATAPGARLRCAYLGGSNFAAQDVPWLSPRAARTRASFGCRRRPRRSTQPGELSAPRCLNSRFVSVLAQMDLRSAEGASAGPACLRRHRRPHRDRALRRRLRSGRLAGNGHAVG